MADAYLSIAEIVEAEISPSAKAVAIVLYHYQNRKSGLCKPAIVTVAEGSGLGITATKKALKELKKAGMIDWKAKRVRASNVNHYRLLFAQWSESDLSRNLSSVLSSDQSRDQSCDQSPHRSESDYEQWNNRTIEQSSHKKEGRHVYDKDFLAWYKEYPRKVGKRKAEESWKNLQANGCLLPLEEMILRVKEYASAHNWAERDMKYIPHPATFLGQDRFEEKSSFLTAGEREVLSNAEKKLAEILSASDE